MSPRGGRRVGAGRPRIVDDPVNFTTWVDRAVLEGAKEGARTKGVTLGQVVRDALLHLAGGRRKSRPSPSEKSRSSDRERSVKSQIIRKKQTSDEDSLRRRRGTAKSSPR
jgi:hypothetical protein